MSQNAANLTFQLLDVGCGIVSAFNALQLLQHPVDISIIAGAFMMVKCGDLHSGVGPVQLHHCIGMVLRHTKSDLQVRLVDIWGACAHRAAGQTGRLGKQGACAHMGAWPHIRGRTRGLGGFRSTHKHESPPGPR